MPRSTEHRVVSQAKPQSKRMSMQPIVAPPTKATLEAQTRANNGSTTSLKGMNSPGDGGWDAFVSFRHAEAKAEAKLIRGALEEHGISCFVSGEAAVGENIAERITKNLGGAKMVVFMGTRTYGTKTTAFSTWEEMQYAQAKKKFIFPIKMLQPDEAFDVDATGFFFDSGVKFASWQPGAPMPLNLIEELLRSASKAGITSSSTDPSAAAPILPSQSAPGDKTAKESLPPPQRYQPVDVALPPSASASASSSSTALSRNQTSDFQGVHLPQTPVSAPASSRGVLPGSWSMLQRIGAAASAIFEPLVAEDDQSSAAANLDAIAIFSDCVDAKGAANAQAAFKAAARQIRGSTLSDADRETWEGPLSTVETGLGCTRVGHVLTMPAPPPVLVMVYAAQQVEKARHGRLRLLFSRSLAVRTHFHFCQAGRQGADRLQCGSLLHRARRRAHESPQPHPARKHPSQAEAARWSSAQALGSQCPRRKTLRESGRDRRVHALILFGR